ncbi:MAG: 50S ribosomal protein P1 [Candidatus Bathyarchaeia archaeon]
MKYIYAALLLHSASQPITEENVKKVLSAAGVNIEEVRVKALVAALKEVNIEEVLKSSATGFVAPAPMPTPVSTPSQEKGKEGKKKEEKKAEEEALAGLGALFG